MGRTGTRLAARPDRGAAAKPEEDGRQVTFDSVDDKHQQGDSNYQPRVACLVVHDGFETKNNESQNAGDFTSV